MKYLRAISLITLGSMFGAVVTYTFMRDTPKELEIADTQSVPRAPMHEEDPFGSGESNGEEVMSEGDDPFTNRSGFHKMNMADPGERDLCISNWYLDMDTVVSNLEFHTGHKFTSVAKMSASPAQILKEQMKFMEEFLAETERIANGEKPLEDSSKK